MINVIEDSIECPQYQCFQGLQLERPQPGEMGMEANIVLFYAASPQLIRKPQQ